MNKLFCTLKNHIQTDDGDFVAAGTPVQVLCWGKNEPSCLLVRVSVYIWRDEEPDEIPDNWNGWVNTNVLMYVEPEELLYKTHVP